MGTRKRVTLLVGLAACVVLAAGLFLVREQRSAPASTGAPVPTGTIGGITWHGNGTLPGVEPQVRGAVAVGHKLFAFGYVRVAGRGDVAAVWSSGDGQTWTLTTKADTFSPGESYIWNATADGRGGLYALIGLTEPDQPGMTAWHSSDTVTWTRMTLNQPFAQMDMAIAAADGVAVVTGQAYEQQQTRRYAWYSADGLTWTRADLPGAYPDLGAPALVAGGVGGFEILEPGTGAAWHSDDGRTWLKAEWPDPKPAGTLDAFYPTSLLVSDGTFVAIGHDSPAPDGRPSAWTSGDGLTWTRSTMDQPSPALGCEAACRPAVVTQIGSALVAVGYRKQEVVYTNATLAPSVPVVWVSIDAGRTWRVRASGSPELVPTALTSLDSELVLVGAQLPGGGFMRSVRGTVAWQAVESPAPSQPSIQPTPSATPSPGPSLKTGPLTFKPATMPKVPAEPWSNGIWYVNGHFYNVFNQGNSVRSGGGPLVWESDDGTSWHQIANRTQFNGKGKGDCAYVTALTEDGNGGLVAVGAMDPYCSDTVYSVAAAWQSNDGVTWRKATIQPSRTDVLLDVAYAGGNLVAVGSEGDVLYSADRGKTWQPGPLSGPSGGPQEVEPWQGGFIVVGGGHAWRSSDGRAWVALGNAPGGDLVSVGGVLMSGELDSSVDGATWTAVTGTTVDPTDWWAMRGGGGIAIALTSPRWSGDALVSPDELWITTDGRTWHDTGTAFVVSNMGAHGGAPSFCIGAGQLVTIVPDGKQPRAFYADLLE